MKIFLWNKITFKATSRIFLTTLFYELFIYCNLEKKAVLITVCVQQKKYEDGFNRGK